MTRLSRRPGLHPALLLALVVTQGCLDAGPRESGGERRAAAPPAAPSAVDEAGAPAAKNEPDEGPRVLFLGTSLTAGLGLAEEEAYPAVVANLLDQQGLPIEAINAGVSGDTSAGGLERLDWLLRRPPDVIVVELGANDGLRGLPVEMTEANLLEVIARARAVDARVIVAGLKMPPNYGADYARRFEDVFPLVARQTGSPLIPFLLEGVAADPELNLPDGIHPNAAGHERIARTVLPFLVQALGGS